MSQTPHNKQLRLQRLLDMLEPPGKTIAQISAALRISERSVYRYINSLETGGLYTIDKDPAGRYFKSAPYHKKVNLKITREEADYLSDLLNADASLCHPLNESLRKRLSGYHNPERDRFTGEVMPVIRVIRELSQALKYHRKVRIEDYFSASEGSKSSRVITPLDFTDNYGYLLAWDDGKKMVNNLKIQRISAVTILDEKAEVKPDVIKGVDDFYMAAHKERHDLHILLSPLAFRLMREEYPRCAPNLSADSQHADYPYAYRATVYNLLPIGRFCLGLPGQWKIIENQALKTYLRQRITFFLQEWDF